MIAEFRRNGTKLWTLIFSPLQKNDIEGRDENPEEDILVLLPPEEKPDKEMKSKAVDITPRKPRKMKSQVHPSTLLPDADKQVIYRTGYVYLLNIVLFSRDRSLT